MVEKLYIHLIYSKNQHFGYEKVNSFPVKRFIVWLYAAFLFGEWNRGLWTRQVV
jgi:hypothetical protein